MLKFEVKDHSGGNVSLISVAVNPEDAKLLFSVDADKISPRDLIVAGAKYLAERRDEEANVKALAT